MRHTYTEDELKEIRSVARGLWDEMAGEAMTLAQECGDKYMTRRDVIELVSDAGRMEEELKRKKMPETAQKWGDESYEDVQKMLKPVFAARYS